MSDRSDKKSQSAVKETQGFYDVPERYEIINGVRYDFLASPKYVHQKTIANLHWAMNAACRQRGEILFAPLDVHFDDDNIAQPDVIFIADKNRSIIRDGYVFGAPDLLVEILSESTGRKDKTVKKDMYERFGVKEYWLADPNYRTVDQFVLENGKYVLHDTLTEEDVLVSPHFACMSIKLDSIFPPEEGNR
jgi:Uma2 family endonuclease